MEYKAEITGKIGKATIRFSSDVKNEMDYIALSDLWHNAEAHEEAVQDIHESEEDEPIKGMRKL